MSYEKEVAELWKEWKKSTEKYEEAIEDGYDVDADMWSHDVMEIERQIYVYEQATKADEYEPKAEAFDEVIDLYVNGSNKYLQTKRHTLDVFIEDVAEILKPFTNKYESECDSNA